MSIVRVRFKPDLLSPQVAYNGSTTFCVEANEGITLLDKDGGITGYIATGTYIDVITVEDDDAPR